MSLGDGRKAKAEPRTHNLMFHGSTTRGTRNDYVDGELRQLLCDSLGPAVDGPHSLRCVPTEWTDMQAEKLQSQAKEDVLRHLRRELRQKRVRIVPRAAEASARLVNASSASASVFDEDSCAQPDTWCRHAGATDEFMTCGGLAGHFCSDIYGDSGFSPCTCHSGTGNCATWGAGVECHQEEGSGTQFLGNLADPKTVAAYTTAKLCLVPAGDTPTSRRLFDAMAAGCVPLLMTPYADIMPNLPFPNAIDWQNTVLFGGGLKCTMNEQFEDTVAWIATLLAPENARKLECMGRRAQRVFTKYLSLRDEGVVSAMLHELQHDARTSKTHKWCNAAVKGSTQASASTAVADTSADAALRNAMQANTLDGLMDAIHGNAEGASPELLDEARALRDELRKQKKLDALNEARAAALPQP